MLRKTALVTAMLGAFANQAYALGLGDIDLQSALNQPLNATIEVVGATPRELSELNVVLASPEAYARTGLERIHFHTKLKFEVVSSPDGKGEIKVTSREPVREPFLDFLIQANWSSGQVVREYTVLVDPPVLMPAPKPAAQAPAAQPAPSTSSVKPTVAPRPAPARTYTAGPGEYTSQRGDSLWRIAEQMRPDDAVSMEQTMLSMLEANPEAFVGNNINNLKAGYVMRIPSREEMTAIGAADADAEVSRQNRVWREGKASASTASTAATTTAAASSTQASGGTSGAAAPAAQPKLKLVAPEEDAGVMASQPGGSEEAGLEDVRKELNIAVEEVEAQRQQNQDLTERLSKLEEQVQQLHRLIELKDQELSSLQGQQIETEESVLPEAQPADEGTASETMGTEEAPAQQATEDMVEPPADDTAMKPETPPAMQEEAILDEEVVKDKEPPADKQGAEFLSGLLNNPIVLAGAAGVVLLIGILLWLMGRKRRMATTEFQESILAERKQDAAPAMPEEPLDTAAVVAEAEAEAVADEEASADTGAEKTGPESDSSLFTDFAVSDMGSIQDESEADPVAEADVYLAYGRFQQAEELVKAAIDKAPDRQELKLKLLEIYHAARNLASFDDLAQAYAAEVGTDDANWPRIVEMAGELNSTHPLFGGSGEAAVEPTVEEPEDLDLSLPEAETPAGEEKVALGDFPEAESEEEKKEDAGLDFDLEGFDEFAKPEDEAESPILGEEALDSDLTEPAMETISDEESLGEGLEDEGEGVLGQIDEVATKLDLARAYIEMGDPDGARSILDEVMEEGSDEQKKEAQDLIGQL